MDVGDLRHEHLSGRIGEHFEVTLEGGTSISLELTSATQPPGDRPDHAHFAEWRGPLDHPLDQAIFELRHDDLGPLPIFLVPVNQTADGFVYEAVFTRVDD